MADSIADLVHTSDMWLMSPNWATSPQRDFTLNRDVLREPGTVYSLVSINDYLQHRWQYSYLLHGKDEEYEMLYFFARRRGKHRRFWTPVWGQAFTLAAEVHLYDDFVDIDQVRFFQTVQGYERLYMVLNDGSMITRQIQGATDLGSTERLSLSTVMDRDIATSEVAYFGRFMLARFDQDALELTHVAAHTSECQLTFVELVREYTLGGGAES